MRWFGWRKPYSEGGGPPTGREGRRDLSHRTRPTLERIALRLVVAAEFLTPAKSWRNCMPKPWICGAGREKYYVNCLWADGHGRCVQFQLRFRPRRESADVSFGAEVEPERGREMSVQAWPRWRGCSLSWFAEAGPQVVFPTPMEDPRRTWQTRVPQAIGCRSDRSRFAAGEHRAALHAGPESHSALLGEAAEADAFSSLRACNCSHRR